MDQILKKLPKDHEKEDESVSSNKSAIILMIFTDASNYSIKDFLLDESFQQLFIQPNAIIPDELTNWLQEYPEKENIIEAARSMLLQLKLNLEEDELQEDMNEVWARINVNVNQAIIDEYN